VTGERLHCGSYGEQKRESLKTVGRKGDKPYPHTSVIYFPVCLPLPWWKPGRRWTCPWLICDYMGLQELSRFIQRAGSENSFFPVIKAYIFLAPVVLRGYFDCHFVGIGPRRGGDLLHPLHRKPKFTERKEKTLPISDHLGPPNNFIFRKMNCVLASL
jgi:hypothetical protein